MWGEEGEVLNLPYLFIDEINLKLIGFKPKGFAFWSKKKIIIVREFTQEVINIDELPSATLGKRVVKSKLPIGAVYLFSNELGCIVPFQINIKNGFLISEKYYSNNLRFFIYNLGHEIEFELELIPIGNYQLFVYDDKNQKIYKSAVFNINSNTGPVELDIR